ARIADFHHRMFVPGSAVLVVAGDVDRKAAARDVKAAFGSWSGKAEAPRSFPAPPPRSARRVYLVDRPGSVQSDLRVGSLGIPRKDPLYYPALMLDGVIGAGAASRLFLIVREEKGYTYDAHSEYSTLRTAGDWSAVTEVRTEVTR